MIRLKQQLVIRNEPSWRKVTSHGIPISGYRKELYLHERRWFVFESHYSNMTQMSTGE